MWKQWLIAGVLLVVAAGGGYLYMVYDPGTEEVAAGERPPSAVNTEAARMETVRDEVQAVATLRALNAVELTTEVSGRVVAINLDPGRLVSKGDVLLQLDDRQARADLQVIEAQLAEASRQLARAKRLQSNNSVSQAQVDELVTAVEVAQARLNAARIRVEDHRIEAPFAGVVGLSNISLGAYLPSGMTITTLDSTDQMELSFAVPERFIGQIGLGQEVRATSPAFPDQTFRGELVELASRISELSRTLTVRALIDDAQDKLRPGQFMSATLTLQEREGLVIPEQALLIRGDEKYVFVAEDGVARRVSVTTGSRLPGWVEVREGLTTADRVIITGQDRLSTGDRIRDVSSDQAIPDNRFANAVEF
ncbi:MAG TPA: efflux RND transporter periplasmic adaptor subunit [Marinobacter sp.]|nr:efflux RND transporter periplasmic adaptor subunit [Marinobacter sp.]